MKYYQLINNNEVSELHIFGDIVDEQYYDTDVAGAKLCQEIKALNTNKIKVYINSYGGSVSAGLAIYNALKMHPAEITTYCQGFACSIASVIFMAGDNRIMSNASLLMIHNAWCNVSGNASELRKQADDLDKITQASINAYMEHANITKEELIGLLDGESWLTPEESLEMGFATEIIKEETNIVSQSVKKSLVDMILEMKKAANKEADDEEPVEDPTEEEPVDDDESTEEPTDESDEEEEAKEETTDEEVDEEPSDDEEPVDESEEDEPTVKNNCEAFLNLIKNIY